MHANASDIRRRSAAVCSCSECAEWDAPRRKAQLGQHGEPVAWRGRWYHRMPSGHYRNARGKLLHRAIWEAHRDAIPNGFHIHHVDGDPGNNELGNLLCVSPAEHVASHDPRGFITLGHEWRSSLAKRVWASREQHAFNCVHCGKQGTTPYKRRRKFCDIACERAFKSTAKITERSCKQCGSAFIARDPRRLYCSSKCNDAAYYARKCVQP